MPFFLTLVSGDDGRRLYRTSAYVFDAPDDFSAKGRAFEEYQKDWGTMVCSRRITVLDVSSAAHTYVRDNPEPAP